jgi:hypothetical protein
MLLIRVSGSTFHLRGYSGDQKDSVLMCFYITISAVDVIVVPINQINSFFPMRSVCSSCDLHTFF